MGTTSTANQSKPRRTPKTNTIWWSRWLHGRKRPRIIYARASERNSGSEVLCSPIRLAGVCLILQSNSVRTGWQNDKEKPYKIRIRFTVGGRLTWLQLCHHSWGHESHDQHCSIPIKSTSTPTYMVTPDCMNEAILRCDKVHSEDENITLYVDGLSLTINMVVVAHSESFHRRDFNF